MDSESTGQLCERSSNACRPWTAPQNNENAYHSPSTPNRGALTNSSNLSTSPCRAIALNESSNQALGETESPVKATHVEKHFDLNRMPTSNESSEQDENQASIDHDSRKRKRNVQESNHDAETKKHKAGDIRTFFSGPSAQSSTKRKNGSKKKESRTAPKKNRGQVDFYFLPKVDGELKSPSIQSRSSQQQPSDSQDIEVDVTPLNSQSISQLKSPGIQDSEVDVPPLINRNNQDFHEFDYFEDDEDDFEDDEDVHSYELQDSDADSDSDSDEETCDICIYKLRSLACPVRLKKLEEASKQCVENLMEDGNITNPKSENFKHVKYDSFYQNYKRCAVYIHEGLDKIGSTCEFQKRLAHYKNKNKNTESCEAAKVILVITCDSLTKEQCEKIENSRKKCLKSMGGVQILPKSLLEILDDPFFHLGIYAHFSEERDHTYIWKRQDVCYIESGLQFLMGYGERKESMHEFCASDHEAFCKNYEFCSKKAAFLSKKMKEKSDLEMEDLKVGVSNLSWEPGERTGQAKNHLRSKVTIARTYHEEYNDMFPMGAIPESSDIDECYNKKHLLKYRAEAQQNCRDVAKKIMDSEEPTVNYVDTNEFAFSYDFEKNQEVKDAADQRAHHLNEYLKLDYDIVHQEDEMILLYTPKSKSFVYFLGPLCKLLGKFSFNSKANIKSATKRAVYAEIFRQLCNKAKGRPDGGKDDFFGNILLAHYLATTLHLQLHMPWRYAVAFGKDILTSRDLMSQNSEFTQLPRRTDRNTLSIKTVDGSGGRDGASSGDFERHINFFANNLITCYPLEEAMQRVGNLFRETGGNLQPGTICRRNVNYGKKNFLSPELKSKWNAYWNSTKNNSGNSEARFWTEEERADGDECFGRLVAEGKNVIRANSKGGWFNIWIKIQDDDEKKLGMKQNSDAKQPRLKFEDMIHLPFKHEGLRTKLRSKKETPKFEKTCHIRLSKIPTLVTRKNCE
ncbi:predicted protein [Chaetoceros tenuissimus]|uniref:Uncharacterized protein n=1 Tax=Chaetoceros tenuissimus TaxID=426638 RepID=A0AAD3D720_9STRA|nr:predicted protein [Chaetoceros tenuissimus]